jgi:hypothetical protein
VSDDRTFKWLPLILIAGLLAGCRTSPSSQVDSRIPLQTAADATLAVTAHWEPLRDCKFVKDWDALREFRPVQERKVYTGNDFNAFLPAHSVAVGDIWHLPGDGLLTFLKQFHPGATLDLHINNREPPGGFACLRAYDKELADILFRIHAEFVLEDGFFTPGQMAGRLVLDRATGRVIFFRMFLPPGTINFDVNRRVLISGSDKDPDMKGVFMFTDAGFAPRMELLGGASSSGDTARWQQHQSEAEVKDALARQFYRFKQIQWVEFDRAAEVARHTGKPLHVISLEGTLDDESC